MSTTGCYICSVDYPLRTNNTVVHSYWYQPWFAWLQSQCPRCLADNRQFLGQRHEELLEVFTDEGLPFALEDFAAEVTVEQYEAAYKLQRIREHPLPPALASLCELWQAVLASIPDDFFWEMVSDPAPAPERPQSWL